MEGQVIEVAAVCKGNSEKVCTEDFDQDIERIKLMQRRLYSLKEALAMHCNVLGLPLLST